LKLDCAGPADVMSEQTFCSEVGQGAPCPYISGHRSPAVQDEI
jgi:hypothetical protein